MTAQPDALPPDVRDFSERLQLLDTLQRSFRLVREYFPDARAIRTELVVDPDACEEWVSVNVDVPASGADLTARDDALLDRWIDEVGWPHAARVVVMVYPSDDDGSA